MVLARFQKIDEFVHQPELWIPFSEALLWVTPKPDNERLYQIEFVDVDLQMYCYFVTMYRNGIRFDPTTMLVESSRNNFDLLSPRDIAMARKQGVLS